MVGKWCPFSFRVTAGVLALRRWRLEKVKVKKDEDRKYEGVRKLNHFWKRLEYVT